MVLILHRIGYFLYKLKIPLLPKFIYALTRIVFSVVLPPSAKVGRGVTLAYQGLGTVIHARAVIGNNVYIGPGVTIGGRSGHERVPVLEDNVYVGAGAKILGPITISRNVVIGANAVVLKDVPPNVVVAGVPARIIKTIGGENANGSGL